MNKFVAPLSLALIAACSPQNSSDQQAVNLSLNVVSNKPYLLSGGNALIEVAVTHPDSDSITLVLNGIARSVNLMPWGKDGELHLFRTLLTGLREGENTLIARSGIAEAELPFVNFPISGPVFSGPHQEPYFCLQQLSPNSRGENRRFEIGNGEYLDAATSDANCSLATRIDYVYRSTDTDAEFLPLTDRTSQPPGLAFTTTNEGIEVPFIVRIETGTINRAIYQVAILHDPATGEPSALRPSTAWNGRLVYTFGGGCEAGYFQGEGTGGVLSDSMLSHGYAVVSSTLNVNAQGGCNDVLSAETAMMVKEHFIESYGEPDYTIGRGGSGGAMQQLLIAGAYPGILDGLLTSNTFPDAVSYMADAQECDSLLRTYVNAPERGLSDETKALLGGWSMWYLCETSLGERPNRLAPDDCPAQIPESARYQSESNPAGTRCSIYDGMRNIFGEKIYSVINTERTFARSPNDNIGVQYGLAALNAGLIDTQLFLDLNEKIGGWDIDGKPTPLRTEADDEALRIAYQTGRISSGGAGLSEVPIIDDRAYLDDIGNFHASVYSFVTRSRLEQFNGHANNFVLRRHGRDLSLEDDNLAMMDVWLANLRADRSHDEMLNKIVRAKPAELQNDCFAANGERVLDDTFFDTKNLFDNTQGACNQLYPPHASLRLVAGAPLTNDILKCQLKAIDFSEYAVEFSHEEQARLSAIFPQGVCDWSKPGVHQQVNRTWLSFGPSPVNRYFPY